MTRQFSEISETETGFFWVSHNEKQTSLFYKLNWIPSSVTDKTAHIYIISNIYVISQRKEVLVNWQNATYSMPCAVCRAMSIKVYMGNLTSSTWRCLYKLDPSHHWVIIARNGFDVQPINNNMWTCLVFLDSHKNVRNQATEVHILWSIKHFVIKKFNLLI